MKVHTAIDLQRITFEFVIIIKTIILLCCYSSPERFEATLTEGDSRFNLNAEET